MRFLVDECTGPAVARWLRGLAHEVLSIYEVTRGISDHEILERAYRENWIIITNDKDFAEIVFRDNLPHRGVILLRLHDERASPKIEALRKLLDRHEKQLTDRFVVVTESKIRFGRI